MSKRCIQRVRPTVTDEEIISLYREGLSQKDIVRLYKVSAKRVRSVLKMAGFKTSNYRKIDPEVKKIILTLSNSGAPYHAIEAICDISVDVIRQLVIEKSCQGMSRKARSKKIQGEASKVIFPGRGEFATQFCSGVSFCSLCIRMGLTEDTYVRLFQEIWSKQFFEADINTHRASLSTLIHEDAASGFSITAIARKHVISNSIVRQALAP